VSLLRPLPGGIWLGFVAGKVTADLAWYGMEALARSGLARSLAGQRDRRRTSPAGQKIVGPGRRPGTRRTEAPATRHTAQAQAKAGHVVVAPDKFKGTLTAAEAAARIEAGLGAARPGLAIDRVPVAGGGDGTVAAAVAAGYRPARLTVRGPAGQPVEAEFAWRDGPRSSRRRRRAGLPCSPAACRSR